ncbi:hypothetical protein DL96DRAFT_1165632 [Flagelloscypha sp. PMI_526]|nr:hypothetical protein DL96DRAFT_1165632 [Flagelloscypha sp. PMI_526]
MKTSKVAKVLMKSSHFDIPKFQTPIRIRLWFCMAVVIVLILLGLTAWLPGLPLKGRLLHFLCFFGASGLFYFILDVEEDSRRIWFWRHAPLIITIFACCFCGGILSEVVQSFLPGKSFDFGDVAANLLGSSIGITIAYYLEKAYRRQREIRRLYQPLDAESQSDGDDDDAEVGTSLLPMFRTRQQDDVHTKPTSTRQKQLGNVWNSNEEIFDIGESDDEDDDTPKPSKPTSVDVPRISLTDNSPITGHS